MRTALKHEHLRAISVRDGKGVRPQISDEAHDASTYLIEDGRWQMFLSGNINKEIAIRINGEAREGRL